MSINWVMLDANRTFVPLPREKTLFTSPARTALAITSPNSFPGKTPLNITSSGGVAYITTQRLIYLPAKPEPHLQSFSAPILSLADTHVSAPFFGPNAWTALLKPVTGGGIPANHAFVQVKMTFKDGGAYDFHRIFEDVKEKLGNAVESARENGGQADLSNVPLEQLPAYEEAGNGIVAAPRSDEEATPIISPRPQRPTQGSQLTASTSSAPSASSAQPPTVSQSSSSVAPQPDEPPPGYEEAQSTGVMNSLEDRLRKESEREA